MTDAEMVLAAANEARTRMLEFIQGQPNPQGRVIHPNSIDGAVQAWGMLDLLAQELAAHVSARSSPPDLAPGSFILAPEPEHRDVPWFVWLGLGVGAGIALALAAWSLLP